MEELNAFLESVRRKYNLPAMAMAVYQEGFPDVVAAVGLRKADTPDSHVAPEDPFHLGSCGKAVTAAVIHNRVEKGELKLDTALAQIFPDALLHPQYKSVTIADMLTHSAGFPEMPGPEPSAEMFAKPARLAEMLLLASALSQTKAQLTDAPKYERGTCHYANFGYVLLGHIAAQVSGKEFERLVREEIFEPLNMKSAGFGVPSGAHVPMGHRDNQPVPNDIYPDAFASAGLIHANVLDWLTFLKYTLTQDRILHPYRTVAALPQEGGGLYTDSAFHQYEDGTLEHGGSNGLNKARQVLIPDENAAFVMVTNDVGVMANGIESSDAALDEVATYVKDRIIQYGDPFRLPSALPPAAGKPSQGQVRQSVIS